VINDGKKDVYKYVYSGLPVDKTKDTLKAYIEEGAESRGIQEAHFLQLINRYFSKIKGDLAEDEAKKLLQYIKKLEFDEINREFKLIDEKRYEKFDLFVELDDRAVNLWTQYKQIRNIENHFARRREFLSIKRDFYDYVISVPVDEVPDDLKDYPYLGRIPKEVLTTHYDKDTGFKPRSQGIMIL